MTEEKINARIGIKTDYLQAAGKMMILIVLSTGLILLSAVFIGKRLDQFFGTQSAMTLVCAVIGVIASALINLRIALKTAARLKTKTEPAVEDRPENTRELR